jgi:FixJ family two-component response regulator
MFERGQTVVVVDDDESVRRALARLLCAAGLKVEALGSAEELLCPGRPMPDCLILDVHLPGLSGLELHERLNAAGPAPPVVFITAYDDEDARRQALAAGAVAFLRKPFEEGELLAAVARALGGAAL